MIDFSVKIPTDPGIYAMYDQSDGVAYVGESKNLRNRINDHITRRNSSVTTGVSAVVLNPDKLKSISWWCHESFSDEGHRKAAEIVAFEVLNPTLQSLGKVQDDAETIVKDPQFYNDMCRLFRSAPAGRYSLETLDNLVDLVLDLQKRISELEGKLSEVPSDNLVSDPQERIPSSKKNFRRYPNSDPSPSPNLDWPYKVPREKWTFPISPAELRRAREKAGVKTHTISTACGYAPGNNTNPPQWERGAYNVPPKHHRTVWKLIFPNKPFPSS